MKKRQRFYNDYHYYFIMTTKQFELTEEEIRLVALYRKKEFTHASNTDKRITSMRQSMDFIDKFRTLIEAEKEMRINSEMIYKYLFRVLSLFNERCNYFGLDSRSHVIDILDEIEGIAPYHKSDSRVTLN